MKLEKTSSYNATLPGGKPVSGSDAKLFILGKAISFIRERSCSEYPSPGVTSTWTGINFYKLLLIVNDFGYEEIIYDNRDSICKYFNFLDKIIYWIIA